MLKKTITYTDYNDNELTEDFYFNLSQAELAEMEITTNGGLDAKLKKIAGSSDNKLIYDTFKEILKKAYGVKSEDGKRFIKNEEVWLNFEQSEAFSELIMNLLTSDNEAVAFVNGIVPKIKPSPVNPAARA